MLKLIKSAVLTAFVLSTFASAGILMADRSAPQPPSVAGLMVSD